MTQDISPTLQLAIIEELRTANVRGNESGYIRGQKDMLEAVLKTIASSETTDLQELCAQINIIHYPQRVRTLK